MGISSITVLSGSFGKDDVRFYATKAKADNIAAEFLRYLENGTPEYIDVVADAPGGGIGNRCIIKFETVQVIYTKDDATN